LLAGLYDIVGWLVGCSNLVAVREYFGLPVYR